MNRSDASWKFVLLGGNHQVAQQYAQAASLRGYALSHFASMQELGYLGRFREFDAAIVHRELNPLSGLELAEYLEKLFQSLPMVLLTEDRELPHSLHRMPGSVIECLPIDHSPIEVLERVEEALAGRTSPYLSVLEPF
jgi:DNA-binding NtrC family response regulator